MKQFGALAIVLLALGVSGCSHTMTLSSPDGDKFSGRYRFGREDSGVMQVHGPEDEILVGRFIRVDRTLFAEGYERTFGRGTIDADGPDLSRYGSAFGGFFVNSSGMHETAYVEALGGVSGVPAKTVSGPLLYWTASLQGDRRSVFGCYLIGSAYTGSGFGRCKSQSGKEYRVDF